MIKVISEHRLDRVVVASCSPRMHEPTFRKCLERAGLNPYLLRYTLGTLCLGSPDDKERATLKATELVRRR